MGIMRVFIVFFALVSTFFSFAQRQGEEVVDGKVFIVHIVEPGNTLFGLQREYNTTVEQIIAVNPTAEEGLQVGQRLIIPTGRTVESTPEASVKKHLVSSGETLFGISRKYDCSVDDIIALNPGVDIGIKVGQELIIPSEEKPAVHLTPTESPAAPEPEHVPTTVYKPSDNDSLVRYTVQVGETLYSISRRFMVDVDAIVQANAIRNNRIAPGDELIIPLKKERATEVAIKPIERPVAFDSLRIERIEQKEKYTISILLPFNLAKNNAIVSGLIDENTRLNNVSEIAVDFYMGMKLALDSLKSLGLVADVYVFDTEASETVTQQLLQREELMKSDIVFGPIFPKNVEIAAQWAKGQGKRIVFPTAVSTEILKHNPYVYAMVPSDFTLTQGMGAYLAKNHWDDNIVIVETGKADEKDRVEMFMAAYKRNLPNNVSARQIRKTSLGSSSGRDLARYFDLDTLSIFVCLTDNVQGVMQFTNTLNAAKNTSSRHGQADVFAVGTRTWMNIDALNSYYRNRFKLHYANTTNVDDRSETFMSLQRLFRDAYNTDASRYAIQGFDVLFTQCSELLLRQHRQSCIMNDFRMVQVGLGNGWENKSVFIIKQDDFQLKLMDVMNKTPKVDEE
jgi:LysM repeat protein